MIRILTSVRAQVLLLLFLWRDCDTAFPWVILEQAIQGKVVLADLHQLWWHVSKRPDKKPTFPRFCIENDDDNNALVVLRTYKFGE